MSRVLGAVFAIALCAVAAQAEDDDSAYSANQTKLTEQLNAQIAKGVALDAPAPPAKRAPDAKGAPVARATGARS
jgi:hypothetical protein